MTIRFIDAMGRVLAKSRIREICGFAELSPVETNLILFRCCDGLTKDQIADLHNITPRQQRALVPQLCDKMLLWVNRDADREKPLLTRKEHSALNSILIKHNLPPASE